jgi:DNA-binding response OmpR family regulator
MTTAEPPTPDVESARLLIIEDDPDVGTSLEDYFSLKNYDVTRLEDGRRALREITTLPPYDVILLDVMLPEKDGFEVLREARNSGVDTPIIMLTIKSESKHKLRSFNLGADDYVTKPFDAKELVARVRAVLRRSQDQRPEVGEVYSLDDFRVDFTEELAVKDGEEIEFTDLEFDILKYLINHRGRTVSRQQLLRDVWGISGDITTRTIDRHVASLREKIEPDSDDPSYIKTVYGIGYKFVE